MWEVQVPETNGNSPNWLCAEGPEGSQWTFLVEIFLEDFDILDNL